MSLRKHIPNAITSLNLLCGVIGIICCCVYGRFDLAFYFMLAAVVFDFCDGLAARLLGAYSEIGKELDSLADMVSFGVLPSLMLFCAMSGGDGSTLGIICSCIPLLLAVFSALRLAKFNLDERQHESFLGLPTPAAALICGSLVNILFSLDKIQMHSSLGSFGLHLCHLGSSLWFLPLVAVLLSALLVSEIPMFSFKFGKDIHADTVTRMKRTAIVSISVIILALVLLLGLPWCSLILLILATYILMNLTFALLHL